MQKKAVVLLSGGLDSTLAACIIKEQGIEVEAVNFQTIFGCCKDDAGAVARSLGIGYTTLKVGDDYLKLVQKPKFGYGRGMNPCIDCRGYMFDMAKKFMDQIGASFLISGEVLGQRPMSQKKRDFVRIEAETGLAGLIVRPLSAKRLPPTEPEKQGILDREKLYGIQGRSRSQLMVLARKYGIQNPPQPSTGCALTSPEFSKKVEDVFVHHPDYERWEFEVLRIGRHFRIDADTKVIVSKNEQQNTFLEALDKSGTFILKCENFGGPSALVRGERTDERVRKAVSIMLRYAKKPLPEVCRVLIGDQGEEILFPTAETADEKTLEDFRVV